MPIQPNMHIHHVSTLEKQNLKTFAGKLLGYIRYLQGYQTKMSPILFGNPVARLMWPPRSGWAITLAQYHDEMAVFSTLADTLSKFVVRNPGKYELSLIEVLLALNKFIDDFPANSSFLLAPGIKESFIGVEYIVNTATEIFTTKMPESMTDTLIAHELELSLKLLGEAMAGSELNTSKSLEQQSSSAHAVTEHKLLVANIEKYGCKFYLIRNLVQCFPNLDEKAVKEIMTALEKKQYQAVIHRLEQIRYDEEVDNKVQNFSSDINYAANDITKKTDSNTVDGSSPKMIKWLFETNKASSSVDGIDKTAEASEKNAPTPKT